MPEMQPADPLTAASAAPSATGTRRELGALVAMLGGEYLIIGMLDLLVLVLAIRVLGLGAAGAGYLNAALGGGAVIGSVTAVWLNGRRRLASPVIVTAAVWAATLGILGAWPTVLGAFLLLGALGTARSLLEVSARTMLLRAAPAAARGRLFGLLEGVATVGLAIGSMLAPVLVIVGGTSGGLIMAACLLALVALIAAPGVRRLDGAGCIRE